MNNKIKKDRFNNFWVIMFSLMVGYLIYFFVGNNIAISIVNNKELAGFVGIFFMSSCIVFIYIFLNFLLERKIGKSFLYIIWIHYFCFFFIIMFCLNIGEYGFKIKFMDVDQYNGLGLAFLAIKNVGIFVPIGYLARKEDFIKSMVFALFFILTIELSQYVFKMGTFDVNEIFFSIIGVGTGYIMFYKKKKKRKKRKVINPPMIDMNNSNTRINSTI